jgi:signal transduction histidine kinase
MRKRFYKTVFILIGLFVFQQAVHAGNIDSLKNELKKKTLSDSMRMETLLQLGWDVAFYNSDSARMYLYECIAIAEKKKDNIKIGSGYAYIGSSFFKTDDYDSALHYYKIAEKYFARDTSPEGRENIIVNRMSMGTVALQQGDHEKAIRYYLQVIDNVTNLSSGDWANLLTAYANTGLVYNDLEQYEKALFYHREALNISEKHSEELNKQAQVVMFVAMDHLNLKKYDSTLFYLNKAERIVKKINGNYFYSIFYGLQGRYYNDIKNYTAAISSSRQALAYSNKANQKFQVANALQQLGISYFELHNFAESIRNFLQALFIYREIKDKTRELHTLGYLSEANTTANNYPEAVKFYQQYISLGDSLQEAATQKKINEIENKYQSEKNQATITSLQKDNWLQKVELKQKRTFNIALLGGCALLLLLAGLSYKNFKNKQRLLLQHEKLHQQQIRELKKERKLMAAKSVMKGQEEERSRLARDLHDGVGGLLSGVKLSMSNMKGNVFLSEENAQSFNNVVTQLDQSIAELRRVSHNMMPEALIKYGLKEALENYCENFNLSAGKASLSGEIKVQLQTYGMDQRIEQNTEIVIYRMIQELLNNVIKHAGAKNVLVQLVREGNHFNLTVEDDGKGFDIHEIKEGAGLANIKARAEYLGGNVDIVSKKGEGTSVHIEGNCL